MIEVLKILQKHSFWKCDEDSFDSYDQKNHIDRIKSCKRDIKISLSEAFCLNLESEEKQEKVFPQFTAA